MGVTLRTGKYGTYWGNDYNSSNPLGDAKRKVNATYIYKALTAAGWTLNAIAGLLGNMQAESTINPGRWQSDNPNPSTTSGVGYSLCQWTPYTKYTNWCSSNGYSDPSEMDSAIARILYEVENNLQWIGVGDYYGMSFKEFTQSTKSVTYLSTGFLLCYERPADQSVSVQNARATLSKNWYNYLNSISDDIVTTNFTPRLTSDGIEGDDYWYAKNPFYQSGYGLPNCPCYAWGRFWEISDKCDDGTKNYSNKPTLPTGNACDWFPNVKGYVTGVTPKLGAVICWSGGTDGYGHVAIVEEIKSNGDIVVSQSAWQSTYFWTSEKQVSSGYSYNNYTFQGFIYNPHIKTTVIPGGGSVGDHTKRKGFNWVLFNKRRQIYG